MRHPVDHDIAARPAARLLVLALAAPPAPVRSQAATLAGRPKRPPVPAGILAGNAGRASGNLRRNAAKWDTGSEELMP